MDPTALLDPEDPKSSGRKGAASKNAAPEQEEEDGDFPRVAGFWDLVMLALSVSVMGFSFSWQLPYTGGLVPGTIFALLGGLAFLTLQLCNAELSSAVPISAGAYGYARLAFGRGVGVIIGMTQVCTYILSTVNAVGFFGLACGLLVGDEYNTAAILTGGMLAILAACAIQMVGGKLLWRSMLVAGVLSNLMILVVVIFCLAYGDQDIDKWAHGSQLLGWVPGVPPIALAITMGIGNCTIPYSGLEAVVLSTEEVKDSKKQVPRAAVWSCVIAITLMFFVPLLLLSTKPGLDPWALISRVPTYYYIVNVLGPKTGGVIAGLIELPIFFAAILCYGHSVSRMLYALSRAGLLPALLSRKRGASPVNSVAATCVINVAMSLIVLTNNNQALFGIQGCTVRAVADVAASISSIVMYIANFSSYIRLKRTYQDLPRSFLSPVGVPGAAVSIVLMILSLLIGTIFTPWGMASLAWYLGLLVLVSAYYLLVARYNVNLSPEEVIAIAKQVKAEYMLKTGLGYKYLYDQCVREFSTENITCWKIIQDFMDKPSLFLYKRLHGTYLASDAPQLVNVPDKYFKETQKIADDLAELIEKHSELGLEFSVGMSSTKDSQAGGSRSPSSVRVGTSSTSLMGGGLRPAWGETSGVALVSQPSRLDSHRGSSGGSSGSEALRSGGPKAAAKLEDLPEAKELLGRAKEALVKVQKELLYLMEKDTLPRLKQSKAFVEYLEKDPSFYQAKGTKNKAAAVVVAEA